MTQIKNKREIRLLKASARITSGLFDMIARRISPGVTEKKIAGAIERAIKEKGLKRSFRTIVAAGPNAAKPHARPTGRRIKEGDAVVIDFGVVYKKCRSDMTRTYFIGKADLNLKRFYATVNRAQKKAIRKAKDGARISDVVRAAHGYIRSRKFGKYILHALGHGIGLRIHEGPKLSEKNKRVLRKNMVVTIEPGLYMKGSGGVRIEDMILITKNGCEVLTRSASLRVNPEQANPSTTLRISPECNRGTKRVEGLTG